MNTINRISTTMIGSMAILLSCFAVSVVDADVRVQLSSQNAYVGMPIQLYIQVSGGDLSKPPQLPSVPGLQFEMAGAPNRTSRVTIFNGRRTESRTTTYVVRVTPRRAGSFEIPPIAIETDRGIERTRKLVFNATTSETGDLMFAEVSGQSEKLYVGQSVEVTLKIWLKPFVDSDLEITLSAANMWQMVSLDQSEWGGFRETLEELAAQRKTVRGREVVRKDDDGVDRTYYLYEIEATLYPLTPGLLEAKDVQVVVQYPLALGRSRDPFASMFGADDFFSGFGQSSSRRSLAVTSTRPIVIEPRVSPIRIEPIPTVGRPLDYRGAVGNYVIATQAMPMEVTAGDPVTLSIGIRGTGPMELVQAPPLTQLDSLATDFKVSDEPLAGVVQGSVKVFSTTIRPRREGVDQIPAIPFSFFDPILEEFVTVKSEPISIVVKKADRLALDAIVGLENSRDSNDTDSNSDEVARLDNHTGSLVLQTQGIVGVRRYAPWVLVIPPVMFGLCVLFGLRTILFSDSHFRAAIRAVNAATHAGGIAEALRVFATQQSQNRRRSEDFEKSSGLPGNVELELQAFDADCNKAAYSGQPSETLELLRHRGIRIAQNLALVKTKRSLPRRSTLKQPVRMAVALVGMVVAAATFQMINQAPSDPEVVMVGQFSESLTLSELQQATLLEEATEAYQEGQRANANDIAEARSSFAIAAQKYQLLVDSGVQNSQLYFNLGNANLQNGNVGLAIVNYQRSSKLNPIDLANWNNLKVAKQMALGDVNESVETSSLSGWDHVQTYYRAIPRSFIVAVVGIGWLCLWGLLLLGWFRPDSRQYGALTVAVVVFLVACGSLVWESGGGQAATAIVIAEHATMYSESDLASAELPEVRLQEGQTVEVIQRRGVWIQIESSTGRIGWVKSNDVERV